MAFSSPSRGARAILLGGVCALALTGALTSNGTFLSQPAHAAAADQTQAASPISFANVVDRVRGAVVSVKVKIAEAADAGDSDQPAIPHLSPGDPLERFFRRFGEEGNNNRRAHPHVAQAQGSGFIISPDGYIVTNNHVVDHATDVSVTLDNGKVIPAKVVGTDQKTDLALLKLNEGSNYPYVQFSSAIPRVGDWVIAVGNPFGLGGTVTAGIVSARGRDIGAGPYDDFLQIDAPVNRGNSGGPTFNTEGQVVGVNTAIYSPSGGSVGIGFAIPAEVAQNVIASLKDKGSVARGWIGVQIQPVTSDIAESLGLKSDKGALVAEAQPGAPAAGAGLTAGDVILGVDNQPIDGPRELARKIAALGPGAKVDLSYWHDGAEKRASLQLGTLPNDQQARADSNGNPMQEKGALASLGLTLAPSGAVPGAGKEGVVVTDLDPDGLAAQKGLKVGDVILEAGGHAVSRPADLTAALAAARKDGRKALLMRIKGEQGTRFVALATNPAS